MGGYEKSVLVIFCLNIIAAYAAWLPLSAGQLNLGIAAFSAIGAYVAAYLTSTYGLSFPVASALSILAAGMVALIVGKPILRTKGIYLALATFALGQITVALLLNFEVVGAAAGYPVKHFIAPPVVYFCTLMVVAAIAVFSMTKWKVLFASIKHDPLVAELFGLDVKSCQLFAFVAGASLAGFGGSIYAHHFSFLEPVYFGAAFSIYAVLYALSGGTQSAWGPIVGAALFTFAPELFRVLGIGIWRPVAFAAIIIFIMAWRREGLITSSLVRKIAAPFALKGRIK
jgi:branched-chain amino acid transport system permease protein